MKLLLSIILYFSLIVLFPSSLSAQAFCALRDPLSTIQKFAPYASNHRSIVREVGKEVRVEVGEALPFTLHLNELGKHTLYVIIKDSHPFGLIHARTERGRWGLVEIVWYFDLELNVRNLSFLRCRDSSCKELEKPNFTSQLVGKGYEEILRMLGQDGISLAPGSLAVSEDAIPLSITVLRSALKTIRVTQLVWADEIGALGNRPNTLNADG